MKFDSKKKFDSKNNDFVFSKVVRAGSRRTYFIDVKHGRKEDYCLVITESRKKVDFDSDHVSYEKNKIFLYKEDFNKFMNGLEEVVGHVKQELMPDYNFEEFDRSEQDYKDYKNKNADSKNLEPINDSEPATTTEYENKSDDSKDSEENADW